MAFYPRSGLVLSPDMTARIRTYIGEREKKIKAVEEEISQLRGRMESLGAKKERLRIKLESHNAFISPIRRLHPEILQEVFKHCLPVAHNAVMCNREAPLLLGQVCTHWRRLSTNSPELWTSLNIIVAPVFAGVQKMPPHEEISAWLSRSGALPLSISLFSTYSPTTSTEKIDPIHSPYIDILDVYKSRWKSIWINIPAHSFHTHFFSRFSASDVPLLEEIHVQGHLFPNSPPLMHGPSFDLKNLSREDSILRAPRLRSISVFPVGPQLLQIPLKWENITKLNLSRNIYHYYEVTRVLILCTNLEACVISSMELRGDAGDSTIDISLPRLQYLSIIDDLDIERNISLLLKGLHTPNLRHLAYERRLHWTLPGYGLEEIIETLSIFLKRLIHPLEEMELSADSILDYDVMQFLDLVPSVKRLALKSTGRPVDLRAIPYPSRDPVFLFGNSQLLTLTPGKGGWSVPPRRNPHVPAFDDDTSGDWDITLDAESDHDQQQTSSQHDQEQLSTKKWLCPNLEVVQFTGSMFDDNTMLKFLKARTIHHQKHNVARLRKASIVFVSGREQESSTVAELETLERETSLKVKVMWHKTAKTRARQKRHHYSPYDGLEAAPNSSFGEYWYAHRRFLCF
ncbi:hypothetical protein D9756_008018 [Leucocoprinus leucothites]|uniref:F-box domain-containing protein n=1 Tax=Leucocoprinus leucothites TaxID=201217 RepID=A0A8H5FYB2_9AGAR|nr:hypothetical protein D9756_008018 [Leucoagaricus leucothites]